MSARLGQYRMLWRAAMAQSDAYANALLGWCLAAGTALGLALAFVLDGEEGRAWAWCTPFAVLLTAWGSTFVRGAVRLNTPANAKLVPHMRARLAELSFATWFLSLAAIAACPFIDHLKLVYMLMWSACLTLGMGLSAGGHGGGVALIFCTVFMPHIGRWPAPLQAAASNPLWLAAVVALLVPLGLAVIGAMFPQGGERHWRMQARGERWVARRLADRPRNGRLWRMANSWYAAFLRRDCAGRRAHGLLAHAFGLGPSRAEGAIGVLGMFVVGVIVIGLVRLYGSPGVLEASAGIGWILASSILFVPMMQADLTLKTMPVMAGEQSLVRLAPLLPGAAPAFNRLLGRALLAQALFGWGLAEAAAFVLTWLSGASGGTLAMQLCAACLALPMLTAPLRDLSRRRSPRTVLSVLLLASSVVVCIGAGVVLRKHFGVPLMPAAAAIALALAAACALRGWRSLVQAPFAFPAGRME